MKKIKYFIACIFMLFSFVSCNSNKDKFMLEGNIENETLLFLDGEELQEKIENKESFVLVIMLSSCSTCHQFKEEVLNPYIQETHATIYGVYSYDLDGEAKYPNKPKFKTAPAILIYNQGENIKTLNYDHRDDMFSSVEGFKKFMSEYVIEPRLIEVSEAALDLKINNKETFVLYIGWNKCGDCTLINDRVITPFLLESKNETKIYYLETDEYRSKRPLEEPVLSENPTDEELEAKANWDAWIAFATKYNFISYRNGKVPSVQYYENGTMKEMVVYLNDKIENDIIVDSYYPELIKQSKTTNELLGFHDKKIEEFLNKYCK